VGWRPGGESERVAGSRRRPGAVRAASTSGAGSAQGSRRRQQDDELGRDGGGKAQAMDVAHAPRSAPTSTREKETQGEPVHARVRRRSFLFPVGHARRDNLLLRARLGSLHGFLFASMKSSLQHCSLSARLRFAHALRLVLALAEPAPAQLLGPCACGRTGYVGLEADASASQNFLAHLSSSAFSVIRSFHSVVVPRSPSLSFSALQSTRPVQGIVGERASALPWMHHLMGPRASVVPRPGLSPSHEPSRRRAQARAPPVRVLRVQALFGLPAQRGR
jgi:hypothetical protein